MKNFFLIILIVLGAHVSFSQTFDNFLTDADLFFQKNVENGKVDYAKILKNKQALDGLTSYIANVNIKDLSNQEQKVFYVNTYNVLVIKQVIENYPTTSPMKIPGFFKLNKHSIAGEKWTLDYLENKVLRKDFFSPELHFVLVCGALGCPKIAEYAYLTKNIDGLMKSRANMALNNENFIYQNDDAIYISEIFSWFKEDFGNEIEFINKYRVDKLDAKKPIKYYTYDWTLNDTGLNTEVLEGEEANGVQNYNPGSLLKKGQIDLTLFNSVYTENKSNWQGADFTGFRSTFAGSLVQFTYGSSENARINLGVDLSLKATGTGADSTYGGISNGLKFTNSVNSRAGLASIAPKIKISPFSSINNFSIQSSFVITLPREPEGNGVDKYWVEWDRHMWWNQFFYTKSFSRDRFQLFLEGDLLFRIKRYENQGNHLDLPASIFLSYFPTKKITLYAMTQHTERLASDTPTDWVINSNFTASGVGGKYQLNSFLILELLYTNFWRAENAGYGETFNLGIKYIR